MTKFRSMCTASIFYIAAFLLAFAGQTKVALAQQTQLYPLKATAVDDCGFTITPGVKDKITFTVTNGSADTWTGDIKVAIFDGGEKAVFVQHAAATIAPSGTQAVPVTFDTSGVDSGEYDARIYFSRAGKSEDMIEQPLVVAGPFDLYILFDATPVEHGMTFVRKEFGPHPFKLDGLDHNLWAGGSSLGGPGWWHSMLFKVTDPRFTNGNMPAANVTVRFFTYDFVPNTLVVDMANGGKTVGTTWGGGTGWKLLRAKLNEAQFAQTDRHLDRSDLPADGYDLRFNTCNDAVQIRSIFIHGYDRTNNPDFTRLLHCDEVDTGRDINVFNPGEKATVDYKFRNLSLAPLQSAYTLELQDDLANTLWTHTGTLAIAPNSPFDIPAAFDTHGLKQGNYTEVLKLGRATEKKPLVEQDVNVMVSDTTPIAKAGSGEFLYGIDTGLDVSDERYMKWLDFMGVDLVRGNGINEPSRDWTAALAVFDKYHIQNTAFYDIRWDQDPAKFQAWIDKNTVIAHDIALKYGERAHYWELGNEPDLPYFFHGSMADYTRGLVAIAKAIHAGNPKAVVMNGGLSFAGSEGDARAREFVKMFPKDSLDVIAYHGHGPLVTAERMAYTRVHDEASKWGKGDMPFFETESGVAGDTPPQIRVQSRTAVEKMVFAQSVHEPSLLWFRLLIDGGDGGYTNLKNVHEPRPCVLSYRTMSKLLHGSRFERVLPVDPDADIEAYLFAQNSGTKRSVVVWADKAGSVSTLKLAERGADVRDAQFIDLFGNSSPVTVNANGTVTMPVSLDPAYIVWDARATKLDAVKIQSSPLETPAVAVLSPSGGDAVHVTVKNFGIRPLTANLTVKSNQPAQYRVLQDVTPITIPAGGEQNVTVGVNVTPDDTLVQWPQRWTVFGNVPSDTVDPATFKAIPTAIAVPGRSIVGQPARLKNGQLDLVQMGGGIQNLRESLCFTTIDAAQDGPITIGAGADYWMAWYVNGVKVWDDLLNGNGGQVTITSHVFQIPLKKGPNLVAVEVLSGSQGYQMQCGGPRELALAAGKGSSLDIDLTNADGLLARRHVPIASRIVVPDTGDLLAANPDAIAGLDSAGSFDETTVINDWAKQPDSTKWWRGIADLSGTVWLGSDASRVYVVAAVTDDTFRPAASDAIDDGDSLRVAIASDHGAALQLGVPGQGSVVYQRTANGHRAPFGAGAASVQRVEGQSGGVTWYKVAVNRSALASPSGKFAVNVLANDDDWGVHKQSEALYPGIDDPNPFADQWLPILLK